MPRCNRPPPPPPAAQNRSNRIYRKHVALTDIAHLYDNAGYPGAAGETASIHRLIAIVEGGIVVERTQEPLPNWACRVLAGVRNAEGRSLES